MNTAASAPLDSIGSINIHRDMLQGHNNSKRLKLETLIRDKKMDEMSLFMSQRGDTHTHPCMPVRTMVSLNEATQC